MEKYYVGVNIKKIINQKVNVFEIIDMMGTNRDVPVYRCVDENGEEYKIIETNLSDTKMNYKYVYGGMGDCFPKSVERFPTFKNGRYLLEYTWGKY